MADIEGLRELSRDLGKIASSALPAVDAVMKKAAQNIKEGLAEEASGSRHFRQIARSMSYDSAYAFGRVGYEIGPDKDKGGELGNIAFFGGANGGGGTLDIDAPLRAEAPNLDREVDRALGRLIDG